MAEDLAQETFLRAQSSEGPSNNGKAWLFSIALNLARDHFRKVKRRGEEDLDGHDLPAKDEDAETVLLKSEMDQCIAEQMRLLPKKQYDVLMLHEHCGLSHGEVAEALGLSEANARVILHRAKAALKATLQETCRLSFGVEAIPCERKPTLIEKE